MAGRRKFPRCSNFPCSSSFLAFSALLSFWYLICNAEFDLNCKTREIFKFKILDKNGAK